MSCVTCHLSHVMCHMSHRHKFVISWLLLFCTKWWSKLVEDLLSTGPTLFSFLINEGYIYLFIRCMVNSTRLTKTKLRKIRAESVKLKPPSEQVLIFFLTLINQLGKYIHENIVQFKDNWISERAIIQYHEICVFSLAKAELLLSTRIFKIITG